MTQFAAPMCMYCRHYDRDGPLTCTAFPDGIPAVIIESRFDHRRPHPDDRGLRYDEDPDDPAPDWLWERFEELSVAAEQTVAVAG